MSKNLSDKGFGVVEVLVAIVVIAVLGFGGWLVWHNHQSKKIVDTTKSQASKATKIAPVDPYAGWKTYCDTANAKGCFKYPNDWVDSQYGGYENSTQTAYIDFSGYNNKDQASNSAYVAQVADVNDTSLNLKIIGSVYNNVPSYAIFNASDVTTLKAGEDATIVTVNPEFQRNPGEDMSFMATPGFNGIKAITTLDQAKAWFSSPEAQASLKVLESFHSH